MNVRTRTAGRASKPRATEHRTDASSGAAVLPQQQRESLLLNIDASFRVYSRQQLFSWSQGMLQNLLKHDLLLCALPGSRPTGYQVDCFASPWIDPDRVSAAFRRDAELAAQLTTQWTDAEFHAIACGTGATGPFSHGTFGTELRRAGLESVIVHGTYDALAKPESLFVIASDAADVGAEHSFLAELIVPYLHLAWMRTHLRRSIEGAEPARDRDDPLTEREKEILRWIHFGKSNSEIGTILSISPLTVKNHVQKILRKLNVQNRTHAVGRAFALRILDV